MGLTRLSLKRPVSTMLLVLALVVFGFYSLKTLRLELMPDMDLPILMVMTVYPGADPESVEELVSSAIEGDVASLSGVDSVYSYSQENMSMVVLQYDYDMDTNDAYLDLRAALDSTSSNLPKDCQKPVVIEMDVNAMPSIMYSVSMADGSDALAYVKEEVVPELEAISTVADVEISGGREDYIRVLLDENALSQYGLSMSQVAQTIAAADFTVPLGSLEQGSQSISAISASDNQTVRQISKIPLFTAVGSMIQLSDVAEVGWSVKTADSVSRFNGEDTVTLQLTKNQSAGTIGMVRDVKKTMDRLMERNSNLLAAPSYDATDLIFQALSSVASTLLIGVGLSMLILFLFFGDVKASLIVGSAMPISLLATVIVMAVAGFSLNILTLGGLVIAIGMMVDNSIVTIESCFRASDHTPGFLETALVGTKGVLGSITASTITTIVVYFPLCVSGGLAGQIFSQLGYTIILSMLASLFSAMTLVPLFYTMFRPVEKKELKINRFLDAVRARYERLIRTLLRHKWLCALVSAALLIGSFALTAFMEKELIPLADEGTIKVAATFRSGTKVEEVDAAMQQIEEMVASHEDVENYTLTASKGAASISVNLKEDRKMSTQEVADQWTEATRGLLGAQLEITLTSQMSSLVSANTGGTISLEGTNLSDIKAAAEQVKAATWQIPGVLNVYMSAGETMTQVKVVIDPLSAMSRGMTPVQVAGGLYSMISGTEAMKIISDGNEYSVYLEFPEGAYSDASSLMDSMVMGIPLSEVARLEYTDSQQTVIRQNEKYTLTVTAVCLSDQLDSVQKQMDAAMADIRLPDSVERTQNTYEEMMEEVFGTMGLAIAVALFLVFLVMGIQFESPRYSLMVMISIPFSLIGSFSLMFVTASTVSLISLMGILTLVGTVVNNGILYVDGVNELCQDRPIEDALIESGQTRLRPMLMTTLTTIISMVPMALGIGTGNQMMKGMAVVIIGGLVASTLLILILMPEFYLIVYGRKIKKSLAFHA